MRCYFAQARMDTSKMGERMIKFIGMSNNLIAIVPAAWFKHFNKNCPLWRCIFSDARRYMPFIVGYEDTVVMYVSDVAIRSFIKEITLDAQFHRTSDITFSNMEEKAFFRAITGQYLKETK